MKAIRCSQYRAVRWLLEHGASADCENPDGQTGKLMTTQEDDVGMITLFERQEVIDHLTWLSIRPEVGLKLAIPSQQSSGRYFVFGSDHPHAFISLSTGTKRLSIDGVLYFLLACPNLVMEKPLRKSTARGYHWHSFFSYGYCSKQRSQIKVRFYADGSTFWMTSAF
jgi:hypothetical protein